MVGTSALKCLSLYTSDIQNPFGVIGSTEVDSSHKKCILDSISV